MVYRGAGLNSYLIGGSYFVDLSHVLVMVLSIELKKPKFFIIVHKSIFRVNI